MKRLLIFSLLCLALFDSNGQTYYKGEWTKSNKHDLFPGIFKITIEKDGSVKGELLWICKAIDSTDNYMLDHYKGKKGRIGIEYVEGTFSSSTNDIYFEGKSKNDPDDILGLDKYTLKLSSDKQVLYGKTDSQGANDGLLYAIKLSTAAGQTAFKAAKIKIKKRS